MKPTVFWCAVVLCIANATSAFPGDDKWQQLMQRGERLETAARYQEAASVYREACQLADSFGPQDPRTVFAINSLAATYIQLGRLLDAEHEYRRALLILERTSGKASFNYAVVLSSIGAIYTDEQRTGEAMEVLHESLAVLTALFPQGDARIAVVQNYLAQALLSPGDYREAELLLNQARTVLEKSPDRRTDFALTISNVGIVRHLQGRDGEAIVIFNESIRLLESSLGVDHPFLVRALNNQAAAYTEAGLTKDADAAFRRALDIARKRLGTDHPAYGGVLQNYAEFLRRTGRRREAKALASHSKEILRTAARRNGLGSTIDKSSFKYKQ
jgi:tetratricopeptide (TPR) repeat protein